MAARYFLVSETGDGGAWLIDVQERVVERIEESVLAGGANVPDNDLIANLIELRLDRNFVMTQGISLAIASESRTGASAMSRREGGGG